MQTANPLDMLVTMCLASYLADRDAYRAVKRLARKYRNLHKHDTLIVQMLDRIIDHDNPIAVVRLSYCKLTDTDYVTV